MIHFRLLATATAAAAVLFASPLPAAAQQSPGWFVPGGQPQPAQQRPLPAPRPGPRQTTPYPGQAAQGALPVGPEGLPPEESAPAQPVQVQLPPAPELPTLPKTPPPPPAVIGVLSAPDVMRVSTAYQQADKELGMRRQKLNEDAQKEQIALRDLGQALANERGRLAPDQIRAREKELQDRITDSRRKFSERNRVIQEAGQYVMAQIDRTLEQVAQQAALSRGVNLVLNRALVLGSTAEFDLTPQVVEVLNKVLPSVVIPPDGVSPVAMAPRLAAPATAAAPGAVPPAASVQPVTQPVSAPAASAPAAPALAAQPAPANASAPPAKPAKK